MAASESPSEANILINANHFFTGVPAITVSAFDGISPALPPPSVYHFHSPNLLRGCFFSHFKPPSKSGDIAIFSRALPTGTKPSLLLDTFDTSEKFRSKPHFMCAL